MIVVVDERSLVQDAYCAQLAREGFASQGFCSQQFQAWIGSCDHRDLEAVTACLIAQDAFETLHGTARHNTCLSEKLSAPVLVLLDQPCLDTIIAAFEAGADDVLRKPMHIREILTRVSIIAQRQRRGSDVSEAGDRLRVYLDGRDPTIDGVEFQLPRRERRILEYLASIGERRATKSQIYNAIYGLFNEEVEETVVESHISKLRKKLKAMLGYDPIDSKRFLGYRLILEDETFGSDEELKEKVSNDRGPMIGQAAMLVNG